MLSGRIPPIPEPKYDPARAILHAQGSTSAITRALLAELQSAWVKCDCCVMDLLDRGDVWESLIDWVEERREILDPKVVGVFRVNPDFPDQENAPDVEKTMQSFQQG